MFMKMIRMSFHDAMVFVNLNNRVTEPFGLHRGVCQGCPLAPYLFILTAESLNAAVNHAMGTQQPQRH